MGATGTVSERRDVGRRQKFQAEKIKADFNEEFVKSFSILDRRMLFNNFNSYY
jgi:hypothetical protein